MPLIKFFLFQISITKTTSSESSIFKTSKKPKTTTLQLKQVKLRVPNKLKSAKTQTFQQKTQKYIKKLKKNTTLQLKQ